MDKDSLNYRSRLGGVFREGEFVLAGGQLRGAYINLGSSLTITSELTHGDERFGLLSSFLSLRAIAKPLKKAACGSPQSNLGTSASPESYFFFQQPDLVGCEPPSRGMAILDYVVGGI